MLFMSNGEVLFSLILPVYNVLPYLNRCLDSCLQQDFEQFEIVCIDDGSTDGSEALLDEYQKKYPHQIRIFHMQNQGVSEARNKGIIEARGKYVWFIDPDDVITENILGEIAGRVNGLDLLILPHQIEAENPENFQSKTVNLRVQKETEFKDFVANNTFDKVWNYIVLKRLLVQNKLFFGKNIVLAEDKAFDFFLKEHINTWNVYDKIAYHYIIKKASASKGHVHNDEYKIRIIENAYWTAVYIEESIYRYNDKLFIETAKKYQYENVREMVSTGIRYGSIPYLKRKISQLSKKSLYPISLKKLKEYNPSFFQLLKGIMLNCGSMAIVLSAICGSVRRE